MIGIRGILSRTAVLSNTVRWSSADVKSKKIGLVGMGHVGDAVFGNLKRCGFNVVSVTDIDPAKLAKYEGKVAIRKTNREVAEESDVIVTSLPKPPQVKEACEGPDGVLAGLGKGKVWVEHSTTDSHQSAEFAKIAQDKGTKFLESPITGGMDALKKGQMATFVAGDKSVFEEVKPILDASYQAALFCGPLGTAMVPKVAANMLCCVGIVAMGELLMVAKRKGVDLTTFWHAIRLSCGNSFLWETGGPFIFNGTYDTSFSLDLQVKDVHLMYEMAKEAEVPTDLLMAMQAIYHRAIHQYGPDVGCYVPPRMLEEALGESLRVKGFENWTYDIENKEGAMQVKHHNIELPTYKKEE